MSAADHGPRPCGEGGAQNTCLETARSAGEIPRTPGDRAHCRRRSESINGRNAKQKQSVSMPIRNAGTADARRERDSRLPSGLP